MTDTSALTDTQRRFLAAVLERLPRERVQELYLFAPLRQGGIETGVAVVAAVLEVASADGPVDAAAELPADAPADLPAEPPGAVDGMACEPVAAEDAREAVLAAEAAAEQRDDPDAEPRPLDGAVAAAEAADPTEAAAREPAELAAAEQEGDGAALDAIAQAALDAVAVPVDEAESAEAAPAPLAPATRFTILMARYRLQLKGPDRGKWEVELREEADAPLVTVDAVVRGVQRRSGEHAEVERLTPEDLDSALSETPWRPTR